MAMIQMIFCVHKSKNDHSGGSQHHESIQPVDDTKWRPEATPGGWFGLGSGHHESCHRLMFCQDISSVRAECHDCHPVHDPRFISHAMGGGCAGNKKGACIDRVHRQ